MNHPSNWIIFYFLSWVKQTKLFMCWELDPNILAIWAFAITWPQLGHNFAKRLNFLPPLHWVCALLCKTPPQGGTLGQRQDTLIQREEFESHGELKNGPALLKECFSAAWDRVWEWAAEGIALFSIQIGPDCVLKRSSETHDGSALSAWSECAVPGWGKLTVKPELLYSTLSVLPPLANVLYGPTLSCTFTGAHITVCQPGPEKFNSIQEKEEGRSKKFWHFKIFITTLT